jgi:hypothetical protein
MFATRVSAPAAKTVSGTSKAYATEPKPVVGEVNDPLEHEAIALPSKSCECPVRAGRYRHAAAAARDWWRTAARYGNAGIPIRSWLLTGSHLGRKLGMARSRDVTSESTVASSASSLLRLRASSSFGKTDFRRIV